MSRKIKYTIKDQRKDYQRTFKRVKDGQIARVAIVQDKATGKILVVGKNYEVCARKLDYMGLKDAAWDINDFVLEG